MLGDADMKLSIIGLAGFYGDCEEEEEEEAAVMLVLQN